MSTSSDVGRTSKSSRSGRSKDLTYDSTGTEEKLIKKSRWILVRSNGNMKLKDYTDVDYISSIVDRSQKVNYKHYTYLGEKLMIWITKKQVPWPDPVQRRIPSHGTRCV